MFYQSYDKISVKTCIFQNYSAANGLIRDFDWASSLTRHYGQDLFVSLPPLGKILSLSFLATGQVTGQVKDKLGKFVTCSGLPVSRAFTCSGLPVSHAFTCSGLPVSHAFACL
jgi:hypothetical protein